MSISRTENERLCELSFQSNQPFWHLSTPGNLSWLLFRNDEDFKFGMALMSRCAASFPDVRILTFELMSNHIHIVASAQKQSLENLHEMFRRKLIRYLAGKKYEIQRNGLVAHIKQITDLQQLRNTIVYVNRNGYVADPTQTPFSYRWGAGQFFFSQQKSGRKAGSLTIHELRGLCHCRNVDIPSEFEIIDGYVSPLSFCEIEMATAYFRDAHQYFSKLTKNVESYHEIAEELSDSQFLTDDEVYSQLIKICREKYSISGVEGLNREQKIKLANRIHYDFRSSNQQIRRVLQMTEYEVNSLFPLTK